ncbi:MAG: hypothetical protein J6V68_03680 [Clostridia bacterium]|nr:hypothetical protein [Clostridia bacterium]
MQEEEKLKKALIKRAVGYTAEEVVSEYSDDNGMMKMVRKKVTKKNVPPDVSALKILLDESTDTTLYSMTDEELIKEKQRLLELLALSKNNSKTNQSEDKND